HKLEPKGKQLVFIGYSKESKGYRLLDQNNNDKIIVSRDVIFDESKLGFDTNLNNDDSLLMDDVNISTGNNTEDSEVEYEIESIMDERQENGMRQFLVKWKNYPES